MRRDRRWKAVALLATGMAIGLVMVATPAGAHVSSWAHNWNKHIKPRADKRYIQPTVLRPGQTLRGAFAFANDAPGSGDIGTDAISFPVRLPSFPIVRIISVGRDTAGGMSGYGESTERKAGLPLHLSGLRVRESRSDQHDPS